MGGFRVADIPFFSDFGFCENAVFSQNNFRKIFCENFAKNVSEKYFAKFSQKTKITVSKYERGFSLYKFYRHNSVTNNLTERLAL